VIAAGTMPCHCTLMDSTGTAIYQYGAAHRNTISWSPHGRFLCLAGFGNLAGEMDFYDTLRSKKIGKHVLFCCHFPSIQILLQEHRLLLPCACCAV
jgi:translation initiation factor 2A